MVIWNILEPCWDSWGDVKVWLQFAKRWCRWAWYLNVFKPLWLFLARGLVWPVFSLGYLDCRRSHCSPYSHYTQDISLQNTQVSRWILWAQACTSRTHVLCRPWLMFNPRNYWKWPWLNSIGPKKLDEIAGWCQTIIIYKNWPNGLVRLVLNYCSTPLPRQDLQARPLLASRPSVLLRHEGKAKSRLSHLVTIHWPEERHRSQPIFWGSLNLEQMWGVGSTSRHRWGRGGAHFLQYKYVQVAEANQFCRQF